MKTKILFALLLIGAAAPVEFYWYHQWKALQEVVRFAEAAIQNPVHF